MKSRLTRKQNAVKNATTDVDRFRAAKAVVEEVDYAMGIFQEEGYPDNWHRWERAKDDVAFIIHTNGRVRT